ncbi:MAG: hypothetical protein OXT69_01045 [Candidatus Poribacteria bacterium]|nr:hypothetical protein [Candidatus Poribacteria bacterium]
MTAQPDLKKPSQQSETEQRFQSHTRGLKKLRDKIEEVEARLNAKIDALKAQIDTLDERLTALISVLSETVKVSSRRMSALSERVDALDTLFTTRIDALDSQVRENRIMLFALVKHFGLYDEVIDALETAKEKPQ